MPRPGPDPRLPLSPLSRRRVLVGGAAAGGAFLLTSWPAGGQDATTPDEPGTGSGGGSTGLEVVEPLHGDLVDPDLPSTAAFDTSLTESPNRGIMFPIFPNSATSWTRTQDTYGACRSGCSRLHQGEDLMAPKMTKMLSVVDGRIVEFRHRASGNSLYIQGDDGWFYCYLHINNDRPGTDDASNLAQYAWAPKLRQYVGNETAARGVRVLRGELVAYCGDSGNAEGSGSHLHFEIRKPATGTFSSETQRLWSSASVNPRESLRNAQAAAERPQVDPAVFAPWTNATDFVTAQYRDFLGRTPTASDLTYYGDMLNAGTRTPDWLLQLFLESAEGDNMSQAVARIYLAAYDRLPDSAGFVYWLGRRRAGWSLNRIGQQFTRAPEFISRYGTLTDSQFVDRVYENVLGRTPDAAGRSYWLSSLQQGTSRGKVLIHFSQSAENRDRLKNLMHVVAAHGVMLVRTPSTTERTTWVDLLDGGEPSQSMVALIRHGAEYRARFA